MKTFEFKVITPQGKTFDATNISHVQLPGEEGFVGFLSDHAPYITSSAGGKLLIRENNGSEKCFKVGTGFFEVRRNQATFMTESFLDPKSSENTEI